MKIFDNFIYLLTVRIFTLVKKWTTSGHDYIGHVAELKRVKYEIPTHNDSSC